jgi:adenylate cyclase
MPALGGLLLRQEQRRLAAILATDVAGYSRLMAADEMGTITRLRNLRAELIEPKIFRFHGRIVGSAGDSLLVEFASAINAVQCAVEVQAGLAEQNAGLPEDERMVFRMGVNLGDVIPGDGTIQGDGVNIAARLEKLAEPGSICIGHTIYDQVKGKLACAYDDLGEQRFHNIPEAVRAYRVKPTRPAADPRPGLPNKNPPQLTGRPSIAVLPFTNMSGDREQEYFSDGITEDIITDLSRVSALFVVARHSAFMFKGKAVDIIHAARQLNVAYILEGSVRKAGNRVRITAQLLDGTTGGHIWAERYDRDLVDIFAVQDEIAKNIVAVLKVKLLPEELKSITDRSTSNADAYEYYLQGRAKFLDSWGSTPTMRAARKLFSKAAEIDPGYAKAYAGIAGCDAFLWVGGDPNISYEGMLSNSDKALQLAPDLAEAHASRAMALYATGHSKEASDGFARALELDPVIYGVHFFYGLASRDLGDLAAAAAAFQRAAALRSDDFASLSLLADVYEAQGLHAESKAAARRGLIRVESVLSQRPGAAEVLALGAANAVYVEDYARAEEWALRAVQLEPNNFTARYNAACAFAVMGKADIAMEHLEYIYSNVPRARQWLLKIVPVDTQISSLRSRTDFQDLQKRLEADIPSSS